MIHKATSPSTGAGTKRLSSDLLWRYACPSAENQAHLRNSGLERDNTSAGHAKRRADARVSKLLMNAASL